jgi:hypothetical protein
MHSGKNARYDLVVQANRDTPNVQPPVVQADIRVAPAQGFLNHLKKVQVSLLSPIPRVVDASVDFNSISADQCGTEVRTERISLNELFEFIRCKHVLPVFCRHFQLRITETVQLVNTKIPKKHPILLNKRAILKYTFVNYFMFT